MKNIDAVMRAEAHFGEAAASGDAMKRAGIYRPADQTEHDAQLETRKLD